MAVIGKNILENLTTGMYSDSKVIYREYIQNSCDQIDKALSMGLLAPGKGQIDIEINNKNRRIIIRDDATGVKSADFKSQLGDIANSDKKRGEDKGFRGIGRLCGLAYCKTLTFRTSSKGEAIESVMVINAKKMRDMLDSPEKYDINTILDAITSFKENQADIDSHYFHVELDNINPENTDLLDIEKVEDYLSFIAPVPYSNKFIFRTKIKDYSEKLGCHIDEYNIYVQGNQIFKGYGTRLYEESSGKKQCYDELFDVQFEHFNDKDGNLIAWMWYGLCKFEKAIPKKPNPMFGFRVRQGNIQIGSNSVIANLFKEERGNSYFVGEIHVVHKDLIPNSQRDYFNEKDIRKEFENQLREYCFRELHKLYYDASAYRKNIKCYDDYTSAVETLEQKSKEGFLDEKERVSLESKVIQAEEKKEQARKKLSKLESEEMGENAPGKKVRNRLRDEYEKTKKEKKVQAAESKHKGMEDATKKEKRYFSDTLNSLNKNQRKLVAQVLGIVSKHVDENTLALIKDDIEKEYK